MWPICWAFRCPSYPIGRDRCWRSWWPWRDSLWQSVLEEWQATVQVLAGLEDVRGYAETDGTTAHGGAGYRPSPG